MGNPSKETLDRQPKTFTDIVVKCVAIGLLLGIVLVFVYGAFKIIYS